MAQGCESPLVTTLTRILCCSAVSITQGPAPKGGTGTPIGGCAASLRVGGKQQRRGPANRVPDSHAASPRYCWNSGVMSLQGCFWNATSERYMMS